MSDTADEAANEGNLEGVAATAPAPESLPGREESRGAEAAATSVPSLPADNAEPTPTHAADADGATETGVDTKDGSTVDTTAATGGDAAASTAAQVLTQDEAAAPAAMGDADAEADDAASNSAVVDTTAIGGGAEDDPAVTGDAPASTAEDDAATTPATTAAKEENSDATTAEGAVAEAPAEAVEAPAEAVEPGTEAASSAASAQEAEGETIDGQPAEIVPDYELDTRPMVEDLTVRLPAHSPVKRMTRSKGKYSALNMKSKKKDTAASKEAKKVDTDDVPAGMSDSQQLCII